MRFPDLARENCRKLVSSSIETFNRACHVRCAFSNAQLSPIGSRRVG